MCPSPGGRSALKTQPRPKNVLFPFYSLLFEKCLPEATDNFCPFLILKIATSTTEWLLCVRHSSKDLHYWIIWSSPQSCEVGIIIFSISQVRQLRNRAAAAPEGSRTRMWTQAAWVQRSTLSHSTPRTHFSERRAELQNKRSVPSTSHMTLTNRLFCASAASTVKQS